MISAAVMLLLFLVLPSTARAQSLSSGDPPGASDNYWKRFAIGAGASLLAHESAHILTAIERGVLACGIGPTFFYFTLGRNGEVATSPSWRGRHRCRKPSSH